jgi:hypothetical protein
MIIRTSRDHGPTVGLDADGWRIVAASAVGPDHETAGKGCQDAFAVAVSEGIAIVVVCDGAGSAVHAAEGATAFSCRIAEILAARIAKEDAADVAKLRKMVIGAVMDCRAKLFEEGQTISDFDATMVTLIATPEGSLVAHVGDGLAGISPDADWDDSLLSLPENGEYSNMTFFVTEDTWEEHLRCESFPALGTAGVAVLMTDGAMPFVIGKSERGLEADFMEPVTQFLRQSEPEDAARSLRETLGLARPPKFNGDDKTLIWLGRVA